MVTNLPPVSLEITFTPSDFRHAQYVLPHQLRVWAEQVQEIVFTLDTLSIFGEPADPESLEVRRMADLLDRSLEPYPNARRVVVDMSEPTFSTVSSTFFRNRWMPPKDFRGIYFYSLFFGIYSTTCDHILHMDSDMLFGGRSLSWLPEALAFLREHRDVLAIQPLMTPPTVDGEMREKRETREPHTSIAYRFPHNFSSRCFLLDKRYLYERVCPLELLPGPQVRERVSVRRWLKAMPKWDRSDLRRALTLKVNPWKFAEDDIAHGMVRAGLYRVSMLGSDPGMWMIHPGNRNERVYAALPALIDAVEMGDIPEVQRGRWDLEDGTIDWLQARFGESGGLGERRESGQSVAHQ